MTDENLVGQTLAGKYRIEKILGKGGMGLVLGARHIKLDEPVAIKLLRPAMMELPGMVARFLREARAASKIKSPHVARVTDVDILEDGVPYMVMEYLEGIDFSELRKEKGTLGVAEAVGYLLQAMDAIAEAHSLGIVHRDLKPSNLFLHRYKDGKALVKVLDFGISKVEAPGEADTTKTGQMMGSPKYMSPEQMLSMRDVDGRSDIWSLGVLLYELLAGRAPFVADTTPRICALVLNGDPAPPRALRPDLPVELEHAILRCLEKQPDRRFATVGDLAEAISPFAPPPEPVTRSGAHRMAAQMVTTGETAVAMAPPAKPAPSATPTPAAWDADTRPEAAPRKRAGGRAAAAILGVAVIGGLAALYLTQRGHDGVAPHPGERPGALSDAAPLPAQPGAAPAGETAQAARDAPKPAAAEPAKTAYSLSDLPDVRPVAAPRPASSAAGAPSGAGPFAKPKPTAADPFGGRRN